MGKGFSYPFRAAHLIATSGPLVRVVLWLAIVNAILFLAIVVGGGFLVLPYAGDLIDGWLSGESFFWEVLSFLGRMVIWMVTLFALFFLFVISANVAAGFFHETLSVRVEQLTTGQTRHADTGFWAGLKSGLHSLVHGLRSLFTLIIVYALLAPLNLIPAVGSLLYSALSLTYTFYRLGTEFLDYPFEVNGLSPSERRALVSNHKALMIGFGGSIFLILLVPIANLAAVPVGVVGSTILYCEVFRQ